MYTTYGAKILGLSCRQECKPIDGVLTPIVVFHTVGLWGRICWDSLYAIQRGCEDSVWMGSASYSETEITALLLKVYNIWRTR